jgi:hypothetical protein
MCQFTVSHRVDIPVQLPEDEEEFHLAGICFFCKEFVRSASYSSQYCSCYSRVGNTSAVLG